MIVFATDQHARFRARFLRQVHRGRKPRDVGKRDIRTPNTARPMHEVSDGRSTIVTDGEAYGVAFAGGSRRRAEGAWDTLQIVDRSSRPARRGLSPRREDLRFTKCLKNKSIFK